MATIQTLNDGEYGLDFRGKLNTNFSALNDDISTLDSNKLESSDIATINGNTIASGGNLVIPTLTDGDKGDIVLSSSGSVWTIDNDVVSFAKMQNITGDRILGRVSGTSGDVGELTGTQVNTILPDATTSLGGRMSAADKTKLDGLNTYPSIIYKTNTYQRKSNYTGAGTPAYSVTIPGGVIASGKGLRVRIALLTKNFGFNDYRDENVIRIDLGGSNAVQLTLCGASSTATSFIGTYEAIIIGTGSASQDNRAFFEKNSSTNSTSTTINTASNITMDIYAGFEYASTSVYTDFYFVTIESI